MSIGRLCTRTVSVGAPGETVEAAARRMAQHDVGTVVVLDGERRPLGVLTDRDVVLRVVAAGRDPATTTLREVMSAPAVRAGEATPIEEAIARMAGARARRLVVVDGEGRLAGIVSVDDVLELLVEEAVSVGRLLRRR